MARQVVQRDEGRTTEDLPASVTPAKNAARARPLDPLITALARAVDRLEGTAG